MAPYGTKKGKKLLSNIERIQQRNQYNIHSRHRHPHRPPARGISMREARVRKKATKHQTSLGRDGETNFMSLPGEIRNEIYRYALPEWERVYPRLRRPVGQNRFLGITSSTDTKAWREPALLRANKSIRIEASSIYYGLNHFLICIYAEGFDPVSKWLRAIIDRCGNKPFYSLHFFVLAGRITWPDLHSMLPLVHVFAETGLRADQNGYMYEARSSLKGKARGNSDEDEPMQYDRVAVPLFHMSYNRVDQIELAMEDAVRLGVHANEEELASRLGGSKIRRVVRCNH